MGMLPILATWIRLSCGVGEMYIVALCRLRFVTLFTPNLLRSFGGGTLVVKCGELRNAWLGVGTSTVDRPPVDLRPRRRDSRK